MGGYLVRSRVWVLEILVTYHLSILSSHNICIMDLMRPDLC